MSGKKQRIEIRSESDILRVRRAGREKAKALGFGPADQTRLATALSELSRNVLSYARSGLCTLLEESNGQQVRLLAEVEDAGPGIPDLEAAMDDGFSTSGGLGAGLPGARRLVHEFEIESRPGCTRVRVALKRRLPG